MGKTSSPGLKATSLPEHVSPMDSALGGEAETLLLQAARAYGIDLPREAIQSALNDQAHGPAFAKWAAERLPEDFLLTVEELSLYMSLDENGHVDKLADLHDLAEVQAVNESDIRTAIDELKRSTESINKQTQTLRLQQDALAKLVQKSEEGEARRQEMAALRKRRNDSEGKSIAAEVEELVSSIAFRLSNLEQQTDDGDTTIERVVESIFQRDDKVLLGLQKLGWELEENDPEQPQKLERLRETCMRLIKVTVESVRAHLDTVYLDTLSNATKADQRSFVSDEEVQALEEEIESLYAEILPVAQMSIEQQHLEPALKRIHEEGGGGVQQSGAAFTYMNECLDILLDEILSLKTRVQDHKSHQAATETMISNAKREMHTAVDIELHKPAAAPTIPMSPVRSTSPTRPARSHTHHRSNSRTSLGLAADRTPLEALLSSLAISLPYSSSAGHGDQIRAIAGVLSERARKTRDVALNVQDSFETNTMAHMEDAKKAIQLLRDSVFAESPFGEIKLVDEDLEESVKILGQEAEKMRKEMETMERDKVEMVTSEKNAEIINRWGR